MHKKNELKHCLLVFSFIALISILPIGYRVLEKRAEAQTQIAPDQIEENQIIERVNQYCTLAKSGRFEDLKELIVMTPAFYWHYKRFGASSDNLLNETAKSGTEVEPDSDVRAAGVADNSDIDRIRYQMIASNTPLAMKKLKLPLASIDGVWINGTHAKVRALFEYETPKIGPLKHDILLEKVDGTWKIFSFNWAEESDKYPL